MILGEVNANHEAVIRLKLFGPTRLEEEIEAVIDTGFTDMLTLPPSIIAALQLSFRTVGSYTLADGNTVLLPIYTVIVSWDGQDRTVMAVEADGGPLIGMALLYGSRLVLDIIDGGDVTISKLP